MFELNTTLFCLSVAYDEFMNPTTAAIAAITLNIWKRLG